MGAISCVGDLSTHGGVVITTNQDNSVRIGYTNRSFGSGSFGSGSFGGALPAVAGALHCCPIPFHGITPILPITTKTFINGKLVLTEGAITGCGALLVSFNRGVNVE